MLLYLQRVRMVMRSDVRDGRAPPPPSASIYSPVLDRVDRRKLRKTGMQMQRRGNNSDRRANATPTSGPIEPRWQHAASTFAQVKWLYRSLELTTIRR